MMIFALVECLLLHFVTGTPSLSVDHVPLSNATWCISSNSHQQQLTCHSSVVEDTASFFWFYCNCNSTQTVLAYGTASLDLDPVLSEGGVYSCVVLGDGAVSISICTNESDRDDMILSCDPASSSDVINLCNQTSTTSCSGVEDEGVCGLTCIVIGSVVLALLLLVVLAVVVTFVYRKWGRRSGCRHRTEDYATVENLEVDTFHSIPYRRDGLPECPINLHDSITDGDMGEKKRSRSRITWPPSDKKGSRNPPTMTWYYSAGRPLPVVLASSSSYDEVSDGDEEDYQLLVDRYESSHARVQGKGANGRQGGGRGERRSVAVEHFEEVVASKYEDRMIVFQREFMSLYSRSGRSVSVAQRHENRSKNCLSTFYPYDDNRVLLQSAPAYTHLSSNQHSDYINASYIDGFSKPKKFIATHVPLPHTVVDFWQMVWQEQVSCLVLLALNEGRSKPRERYCSDGLGTWCIGPFLVTTTHRMQCAHHTIRYISVQVSGCAPLEICQLQITGLSRQGMPHMAPTLLAFHRRFRELTGNTTQPTVVHCSTGAGLTGVFVAVDYVLEAVEEQGTVDVWNAVNSLRQHRPKMVPTMEQYMLIHEVVLEWVRWGNTEMPVCQLTTTPIDCRWHRGEREGGETVGIILKKLFQAVSPVRSTPVNEQVREQPTSYANPLCVTHTTPGMPDSVSYHRPTSVTGYWHDSGLLVTHSPTHSSAAQFWRTVLDKRCGTIIAFSPLNMESYRCWPDCVSSTFTAGQYSVHLMNGEEEGEEGEGRYLRVEHTMSDRTHVVSRFHVVDWTGDMTSQLCGAVEMLLRAQKTNTHTPILIHCSDGVSVCGVVCVVMMVVEQGLVEGLVDIPCAVRKIRAQLPTAISTMDQLQLVVKTVTAILNKKLR